MVAFLAALPAIFAAIKGVSEVFDLGKQVVEEIKGEGSKAQTPEDLQREIEHLNEEEKASFVERMQEELQLFEAMSQRLSQQGGQVDAQTLGSVPEDKRGDIAHMRMTTRPWAVRWMVIAVVFPPLASVAANLAIAFYNVLIPDQRLSFVDLGDVLNELYLSMVGWASGVIMTYMGMREIGKAVGHRDQVALHDITGSLQEVFGNMKRAFMP